MLGLLGFDAQPNLQILFRHIITNLLTLRLSQVVPLLHFVALIIPPEGGLHRLHLDLS